MGLQNVSAFVTTYLVTTKGLSKFLLSILYGVGTIFGIIGVQPVALPFLGVPIKDYLVHSLSEVVTKLGIEVKVKITEMNQRERDRFIAMEQKNWKGFM